MSKRNRNNNANRVSNANNQKKQDLVNQSASNTDRLNIVIPVYGKFDLLTRCVEAIPAAMGEFDYDISIFDNASPDDNASAYYKNLEESSKVPPQLLRIFMSKTNLGFAIACNRAAMRGRGNNIFFLNSDCIMKPDSIAQLLRTMNADPTIGIVAPMLVFPTEKEMVETGMTNQYDMSIRPASKVQHVGMDTSITGDFIHTFVGWSPNNPRVMKSSDVYAVTGAALLTRRFLWNRIGGFWEGYGHGTYEDVDYCLTVRELGYNIKVIPSAIGTHFVSASASFYKVPFPLGNNRNLFISRWGNKLQYTEWERW